MSNATTTRTSSGTSPAFLLFVVFLVLKLTHVIGWSWWWVTAPLWASFALAGVIILVGLLGVLLLHFLDR